MSDTSERSSYLPKPHVLSELGTAFGIVILLPRLLFAMQMDQSFHHYLGWMLTKGGLPYVASFDQNFPGGAVIYALAIFLFGTSPFGFAVFDLIAQSICLLLISRLALRLDTSGIGSFIAPLLYAFTYIGLGVWDVGQRDGFVAPMLVRFLLLLVRASADDKPKLSRWLWIGLLVGIMTLTRPMFILSGLIAIATAIGLYRRNTNHLKGSLSRLIIGAAILPIIVIAIYAVTGHVEELYDATIRFNVEVYGKFRHGVSYRGSGEMTILLLLGLLGFFALTFLRRTDRKAVGAAAMLLSAAAIAPVSTFIQGQGDAHHMVPTYAVVSVLAGIGFSFLIQLIAERRRLIAPIAVVLITVVIAARGYTRIPMEYVHAWLGGTSLDDIYAMQKRGEMDLRDEIALGQYLRSRTAPQDHIQIFSMRIWPYVLAGRTASSRFQTHEHLLMQPHDQPVSPVQVKWRKEFMSDMQARPPKYFIITTDDHLWLMPHAEPSIDQLKRFPELASFISRNFLPDTTIGSFRVLKNRDLPNSR